MSQMDEFQRAAQFWAVLVLAARTQQVLSYTMMEKMTGIPQFAQASILGNIYHYCKQNDLPLLPSLVIQEKTGRPASDDLYNEDDIRSIQARVFVYDWLSHGVPKVEDFKQARQKAEAAKAAKAI
jgi:hypothetical protein